MYKYEFVLAAATELSERDRVRLIDALWEGIAQEDKGPISDEWLAEINRRMEAFEKGHEQTVPWSQVRDEASARLNSRR